MNSKQHLTHDGSDTRYSGLHTLGFTSGGENVAGGAYSIETFDDLAKRLTKAWWTSNGGHKESILDLDFDLCGVAVSGRYLPKSDVSIWYATQLFCNSMTREQKDIKTFKETYKQLVKQWKKEESKKRDNKKMSRLQVIQDKMKTADAFRASAENDSFLLEKITEFQ